MALPTSGTISMGQIRNEVSDLTASNPISLNSLESGSYFPITRSPNKPNGTTPNRMGEWYGYQGGHIINIEFVNYSDIDVDDYGCNYYPDDYSNDGYEFFHGSAYDNTGNIIDMVASGTTTYYPEYPLWFYNNKITYGAFYLAINNLGVAITDMILLDNNNNIMSSYVVQTDFYETWGSIYYSVPPNISIPYYKVRVILNSM